MLRNLRPLLKRKSIAQVRSAHVPINPLNVTIAGATSDVGLTTAFLLKQSPEVDTLFVYDRDNTKPIACHLNQMNTNCHVIPSRGIHSLPKFLKESHIFLICGGQQTLLDESEQSIFYRNANFVRQMAMYCAKFNPRIAVAVVTPPVASMVPLVVEVFKKEKVLDHSKIYGVVTPAVCRSNTLVARHLNVFPGSIQCLVVGGSHRRMGMPVLSQLKFPLIDKEKLWRNIIESEEDVILERNRDNCYRGSFLLISHSAAKFAGSLIKAMNGARSVQECAFIKQSEPLHSISKYLTTIVTLGADGVVASDIPKLSKLEKRRLEDVLPNMKRSICMGEFYITGDDFVIEKRREMSLLASNAEHENKDDINENIYVPCDRVEKLSEKETLCRERKSTDDD